jgi:predicted nucleic acid-binding protein
MAVKVNRYYWDSCVVLSYLEGTADRVSQIESFLRLDKDQAQLVTSVLTITEVAFQASERHGRQLNEEIERNIDSFWKPESRLTVVELFADVAQRARSLIRDSLTRGWSLKPADAIHLATADHLAVTEFHTYDEGLAKFRVLTRSRFRIGPPEPENLLLAFD